MSKVIEVDLFQDGVGAITQELESRKRWLEQKTEELCRRLSEIGVERAQLYFSAVVYDGIYDFEVHADLINGGYSVKANGEKILFVEFGTGLIGYGHPEPHGMIPGSYSETIGKGHWDNPSGWWYSNEDGSGHHSYGNPPNMPMYNTVKELEQELVRVAREVFAE